MTRPQDPNVIELSIDIAARPETVFRFFSDAERYAQWMGEGSAILPGPDGTVRVSGPGGPDAVGRILEWVEDRRLVFSWGHETGGPVPPESTRVTIELTPIDSGTRVTLRHEGLAPDLRPGHYGGWSFFLAQLSGHAAALQVDGRLEPAADAWCAAWNEGDAGARDALLQRCFTDDAHFRDAFSAVHGRVALGHHIAGVQPRMPNQRLERVGAAQQCHEAVRFGWRVVDASGTPVASGSNYCELTLDGRFRRVVGFWDPATEAPAS